MRLSSRKQKNERPRDGVVCERVCEAAPDLAQPFDETTADERYSAGPTHIKDLVPDPANRRQHNARNIGMVVDALQLVGAARSIVIDEDNVILAGNGVTEAAAEAGITRVRVIEADGHELIAVRRRGLTDAQKRALAIADNRSAELATWDVVQLAADADAGLDLAAFWTPVELADLLGADAPVPDFPTGDASAQGQLDTLQRRSITCPSCGHAFTEGA